MRCSLCKQHVGPTEHRNVQQEQIAMRHDLAQAYDGATNMVATRKDGDDNALCRPCHERAKHNAEGIVAYNSVCCGGHH